LSTKKFQKNVVDSGSMDEIPEEKPESDFAKPKDSQRNRVYPNQQHNPSTYAHRNIPCTVSNSCV
jgi:hypothetical protein